MMKKYISSYAFFPHRTLQKGCIMPRRGKWTYNVDYKERSIALLARVHVCRTVSTSCDGLQRAIPYSGATCYRSLKGTIRSSNKYPVHGSSRLQSNAKAHWGGGQIFCRSSTWPTWRSDHDELLNADKATTLDRICPPGSLHGLKNLIMIPRRNNSIHFNSEVAVVRNHAASAARK